MQKEEVFWLNTFVLTLSGLNFLPIEIFVHAVENKQYGTLKKLPNPNVTVSILSPADSVNIKILNAGAWSRSSEKVFVSLPTELEDLIPEVEDFYKKNHSGRKLHWHHLMSNGIVSVVVVVVGEVL